MSFRCERCGRPDTVIDPSGIARAAPSTDCCAVCGKGLCVRCMDEGCCGHVPAMSGEESDAELARQPGRN